MRRLRRFKVYTIRVTPELEAWLEEEARRRSSGFRKIGPREAARELLEEARQGKPLWNTLPRNGLPRPAAEVLVPGKVGSGSTALQVAPQLLGSGSLGPSPARSGPEVRGGPS